MILAQGLLLTNLEKFFLPRNDLDEIWEECRGDIFGCKRWNFGTTCSAVIIHCRLPSNGLKSTQLEFYGVPVG